ncbi:MULTISPECIES: SH3 domain-containing protein [unclassified Streptomyces]|uniref:SH3 domain-containing protein n=1 Tax=unclassified Streptomyces TaxID=2593676 RepID=UPI00382F01E3
MRTTPALRILTAALLTGGTFAGAAAGTTAAAATPPTYADGHGGDGRGGGPIWGTIVSRTELSVRAAPSVHSRVVDRLSPGSQDRVQCRAQGQSFNGDASWYWFVGAQGWVPASYVDTGGRWVPTCADPCPQWRNGSGDHRADRNDSNWSGSWS